MQTSPSVMAVEGEDIMNRFRTVLVDPVLQEMDYRTSCIKASEIIMKQGIVEADQIAAKVKMCRDNCEHLNLLVDMREKYEIRSPAMVEAGLEGPDANQFRLQDDFCKSCLMARQDGLHRTWWQRRGDRRAERKETKREAKISKAHDKAQLMVDRGKDQTRKQVRNLREADLLDDSPGNEEEGKGQDGEVSEQTVPEIPELSEPPAEAKPVLQNVQSVQNTEKSQSTIPDALPPQEVWVAPPVSPLAPDWGAGLVKVLPEPTAAEKAAVPIVAVPRNYVMKLKEDGVRPKTGKRPDMTMMIKAKKPMPAAPTEGVEQH